MSRFFYGYGLALLVLHVISATGKGDTYTPEELQKLPKLLAKLKTDLTKEYMFENKFLIRFLRARVLDVNAAETMLRKFLKWRKQHNLDNILNEDFSSWERKYTYYFTFDRDNVPTIVSSLQGIDFRKLVINGMGHEVIRYIYYGFERGMVNLQRANNETGIEYTSGHLLFNMAGYTSRTYACLGCIPYWIDLAQVYEAYYPQFGRKLIVINAPRILQSLVTVVTPFLNSATVESAQVYTHNKDEWQRELLKMFSPEKLTPEFGGTLKLAKGQVFVPSTK